MTRQWRRFCRITVTGGSVGTLDVSTLRCRFTISDPSAQSPRKCVVRITNLADATAQGLPKNGGKLRIEAGYEDGYSLLFEGDIQARNLGRENPTDTYADLYASDGGKAYQNATISKTLPGGSTGKDVYGAVLDAMKPFGITAGNIPKAFEQLKDPRAQVHFGMARDVMRKLALAAGCTWKIQGGKLNAVPIGEALPGGTIVLNSSTGMIQRPVQTDQGIIGRALLNPRIQANAKVEINEKSIDRAPFAQDYAAAAQNSDAFRGHIAADGIYKVIRVDHTGDTRGQAWNSEFVCNALGFSTVGAARQGTA